VTVQKQLLGRGTYGPRVDLGPGVSPLWSFILMPPAQNSLIIYNDGSVVEGQSFDQFREIDQPDVYMFILGGTDFRCDEGSFEYDALTAAGYTWRNVYTDNVYPETYDTELN